MASSELSIEVIKWSMNLEQTRTKIATQNIATANVAGTKFGRLNHANALQNAQLAFGQATSAENFRSSVFNQPLENLTSFDEAKTITLDEQVADMTSAELKYRILAETMTRQLSLLSLAASGR